MKKFLSKFAKSVLVGAVALSMLPGALVSAQQVSLNLWHWDSGQADGVRAAVQEFMAQNPDVKINVETIPAKSDFLTKLNASFESGTGPDVYWASYEAKEYFANGLIEPLNTFIEADGFDLGLHNETIASLYANDEAVYGLPKDMDAWFIIYNKQLFEENGVELPSEDWTWDDMLATAAKFREIMNDGQYPLYFNSTLRNGLGSIIEQAGGNVLVKDDQGNVTPNFLDNGTGVEAFNKVLDLVQKGYMPNPAESPDYDPVSALISRNVAFAAIPSWSISGLNQIAQDGQFAAVKFPSVNGSFVTDTNGLSYVMSSKTANKEAAWKLISFLTSDEGAKLHAANGAGLPANKNEEVLKAWVEANNKIENLSVVTEITQNNFLRISTAFPEYGPVFDTFQQGDTQQFFLGNVDAETALKNLNDALNNQ